MYLNHVTFSASPFDALNAPVTEYAIWKLKDTTDALHFRARLNALIVLILSFPKSAGVFPGGWGVFHEDERQFMVLLGWESLEVRPTRDIRSRTHMSIIAVP